MSGTSFDGLDVAVCRISGEGRKTKVQLSFFETVAYENSFKEELKSVFAKKDGWLEKVCLLNPYVASIHARIILQLLKKWGLNTDEIDLIASHGQTIYHAPKFMHPQDHYPNATLQIGDGDHLSVLTGIITISDFRQKHIAAGGEGAPLAVYADYLLFSDDAEDRVMLNIGGISNLTWLPAGGDENMFSTDIGPGNTMLDAYVQQNFNGKYFDENAALAKKGRVIESLLNELNSDEFFMRPFPKTTGPELFGLKFLESAISRSGLTGPDPHDILATLTRFTADGIVNAIKSLDKKNLSVFVSGGGMHNPLLMEHLRKDLANATIRSTEDLGINPDAKEAVLFALLANECVCGSPGRKKGLIDVSLGKISFPA